jgi:putative Ca2+/H+ antiporter (TMEM165/GDT1 family)
MFTEYIGALFLIFAAEMGDKTQILAMMFATKYKMRYVLLGIFIGSFLNHGLAVVFGSVLGSYINPAILQTIAGLAFVLFSIWTLTASDEEEEDLATLKKHGAIMTVASAFFIGELGDKTQLTAITLAVDAAYPFLVLLGTVTGMLVTSSLGIFVGSKLGDKIPELGIKLGSSSIFLGFGVVKLVTSTPQAWINSYTLVGFFVILAVTISAIIYLFYRGVKNGELTPFRKAAEELYQFTHQFKSVIKDICLGTENCEYCKNQQCGIGLIYHIIHEMETDRLDHEHIELVEELLHEKNKFPNEQLKVMHDISSEFLERYKQRDLIYNEVQTIQQIIEKMIIENDESSHIDLKEKRNE